MSLPDRDRRPLPLPAMAGITSGQWLGARLSEPDPALAAEGWERRFVTGGPRADEVVELYRQLGFEVRLEPVVVSDMPDGCTDCQVLLLFHFHTVYTRRPASSRDGR